MTYHTGNKIRKYVQGYGFMSFAKKFGSKYAKRIKTSAEKLNQSKYGKVLKKRLVNNFLTKSFLQILIC